MTAQGELGAKQLQAFAKHLLVNKNVSYTLLNTATKGNSSPKESESSPTTDETVAPGNEFQFLLLGNKHALPRHLPA